MVAPLILYRNLNTCNVWDFSIGIMIVLKGEGEGGGGTEDGGKGKVGGGVFGKRPVRGEASVPVLTRTRKSGYDSGLDYH